MQYTINSANCATLFGSAGGEYRWFIALCGVSIGFISVSGQSARA